MRKSHLIKRILCSFLLLLFVTGSTLPMVKVRADFYEETKGPSCWIDVSVEDWDHIYEAMSSMDDSGRICRSVSLTPYLPGETVTFSIMVGNDGTTDLENILVTDELLGFEETIPFLAPGEMEEFYATYIITEEDAQCGFVLNLAAAQATLPPAGEGEESGVIRAEDADEVPAFSANPSVAVFYQMLSGPENGMAYSDWEQAYYIIRVHNTGNVPLENLLVNDEKADYAFMLGLLEADEIFEEEMSLYVQCEEAEEGIFRNTVTVSCENPLDPASGEITASLVMELPAEAAEEDEYTEEEAEEEEAEAEELEEAEAEEAEAEEAEAEEAEEAEAEEAEEAEAEEAEEAEEEEAEEAEAKEAEEASPEETEEAASEEMEADELTPGEEEELETGEVDYVGGEEEGEAPENNQEADIEETAGESLEEEEEMAVILPEPYTEEELVLGAYEEPDFTGDGQTAEHDSAVIPGVDLREGIAAGLYISHNEAGNVPVRSARMVAASNNSPVSGIVVSNNPSVPEMGDAASLMAPLAGFILSALGLGLVWKKKS